ncbi:hypothetical protein DMN91_006803 [Ooceraea biroi]|uniref:Uncharacterized protein n=1 Tax=Ooceraea biroi TaxID=2015173 RepID=A0A3L8DIP6_OOCBI|nr:hypothetical protein DMN91_006803 [Ooceraea biroi]
MLPSETCLSALSLRYRHVCSPFLSSFSRCLFASLNIVLG